MRVLALVALRNLVQARRRSLLLGLAIGLVTMLLVLLSSLSAGIRDNLIEEATTMSSGHVTVGGFFKPSPTTAAPLVAHVGEIRAIVEQNTPGLDYVVLRGRGWGKIASPTGATQAGLSGLHVADESRFFERLELARESEYKEGGRDEVVGDARRLAEPNTVVLFAGQARRLDVGVGDVVTVQTETFGGQTNTVDLTVVAVARDLGLLSTFAVFVPQQVILDLYRLDDDTTGAIWVYLDDIERADETMAHLRRVFAEKGYPLIDHQPVPFFFKFETVAGEDWTGQKLDVTTWEDEVSFLTWVITAFDTVTWFLIAILVVIIAVGIMNAMWNAVRERTREIGTMRAIGMRRSRVLLLFLTEALLLGLISTGLGAIAGAAGALAIDAAEIAVPIEAMSAILLSDTLNLSVHASSLVGAIVALTLFTVLAAAWPAVRAARLPPIQAIGHTE